MTKKTERVVVLATPDWVKEVDDWRRKQVSFVTRPAAIRYLTQLALDAQKPGGGLEIVRGLEG
jgi:hypothetical protein